MGLDNGCNTSGNISILMVYDHKMTVFAFRSELRC
jgi:hypothetical protein